MQNKIEELLDNFVSTLASIASMRLLDQETEVAFSEGPTFALLDARLLMKRPNGDGIEVAVDVLRKAYPRDVRVSMQKLLSYEASLQGSGSKPVLCVLADYMSPGSRELLKQAGISYCDSRGSMYFHHPKCFIEKDPGPKPRQSRRAFQIFTGAREQVIHALLIHSQRARNPDEAYISGTELAALAQTSPYTVSLTMQELEREELVKTLGKGPYQRRRLLNASALLDAWAASWVSRREAMTHWYAYTPTSNPIDMVMDAFNGRHGWAITGAAAANLAAPYLTSVDRVQVIVPPGASLPWSQELNCKPTNKGANIVMLEREGASVMFSNSYRNQTGSLLSSHFIQYLDLLDGYGRNKELAEVFRRQVLKV